MNLLMIGLMRQLLLQWIIIGRMIDINNKLGLIMRKVIARMVGLMMMKQMLGQQMIIKMKIKIKMTLLG